MLNLGPGLIGKKIGQTKPALAIPPSSVVVSTVTTAATRPAPAARRTPRVVIGSAAFRGALSNDRRRDPHRLLMPHLAGAWWSVATIKQLRRVAKLRAGRRGRARGGETRGFRPRGFGATLDGLGPLRPPSVPRFTKPVPPGTFQGGCRRRPDGGLVVARGGKTRGFRARVFGTTLDGLGRLRPLGVARFTKPVPSAIVRGGRRRRLDGRLIATDHLRSLPGPCR